MFLKSTLNSSNFRSNKLKFSFLCASMSLKFLYTDYIYYSIFFKFSSLLGSGVFLETDLYIFSV